LIGFATASADTRVVQALYRGIGYDVGRIIGRFAGAAPANDHSATSFHRQAGLEDFSFV
jgi:hypothetical protein